MTDNEMNRPEDHSQSQQAETQTDTTATLKPGRQLAEYREKSGLSVEHVASRLKMTVKQVQNLEADNYDALHGVAISRGFVRAYARLLQVDPEPLVALFPSDKASVKTGAAKPSGQAKRSVSQPFEGKRQPFQSRRSLPAKLIGIVAVALVVVGVIVVRQMGGLQFTLPFAQKSVKAKESPAKEAAPQASSSSDAPPAAPSGSVSTEVVAPKTVMTEEAAAAGQAKQEVSPPNPAPAPQPEPGKAETTSKAAPDPSGNKLVLRFRENSWMQIVRSDSTVLFERLVKAGETETFDINEPVSVTIGYGPGVEATYKGVPLEMKIPESSTVVRMKLK